MRQKGQIVQKVSAREWRPVRPQKTTAGVQLQRPECLTQARGHCLLNNGELQKKRNDMATWEGKLEKLIWCSDRNWKQDALEEMRSDRELRSYP